MRLEVFDILSLIKDHVVPFLASEGKVVLDDELVGRDADVERVVLAPAVSFDFSFFLGAKVS